MNCLKKKAIKIKSFLVLMDKRANMLFSKWANFIHPKGASMTKERRPWIKLFNTYLVFAIWVIAPIVFILFLLTYPPLINKRKRAEKYYSSIDLK